MRVVCLLLILFGCLELQCAQADDDAMRLFENEIRPILVERCGRCHGADEQEGGLRVDSREGLIKGGDIGSAVIVGNAKDSLMIQAVNRSGELQMPPDERLGEREVTALETWINSGATWPESTPMLASTIEERSKKHWAFQPLQRPHIPDVKNEWIRNPIDGFVLDALSNAKLRHSPEADRRTLVRRLAYTLTGLPPDPALMQSSDNSDEKWYEQIVDELLSSTHYGEHWGRHWLDVARYSDSKGYVYAREERFWVHAWNYRDWVVNSLNEDMPYDRFLLLQLAADQIDDRESNDLAAMGFLTLGRRFLGARHLIIDDRIDVVTRGTMALTVSCARCHDHKYDPIPTADYYSLYGVFDSCSEQLTAISNAGNVNEAFQVELKKRQNDLDVKMAASRREWSERIRGRVSDYLIAQTELHKYPAQGFDQVFSTSDMLPSFVRQWEDYLHDATRRDDSVFVAWRAYETIPTESFKEHAEKVTRQLSAMDDDSFNPIVAQTFESPPESISDVAKRYGEVFAAINTQWKAALKEASDEAAQAPSRLSDAHAEQLRQILYGPGAPCEVPNGSIVDNESFFDSATCTTLWKLQGEVDRLIRSDPNATFALTLVDRTQAVQPRVFVRGNSVNKGDDVPRQLLSLLTDENRKPFQQGSGRLELARAITDRTNPLTARVIVNRVWAHHFGRGLVPTTSDFGLRAASPSHPELLDWLTAEFIKDGWSLKRLHRLILLSSTWRQSSFGPVDSEQRVFARDTDPTNRFLWRMNSHRLSFEETRDSMLVASKDLDRTQGGSAVDLLDSGSDGFSKRRTLYGVVDRQFLPGVLRVFDFANPDLHVAKRAETTVPQQSLFFMNHPMVLERVRALAKSVEEEQSPTEKVEALFRQTYQRDPSESEIAQAINFVDGAETEQHSIRLTAADWQYGFGSFDEKTQQVTGFTPLPHFTGAAWQGGAKWPDVKLGWVQLTAAGGHPGNDRNHASIRRWTAPRSMTIDIQSALKHQAEPGDGIRVFVVSSRAKLLGSTSIHNNTVPLNVEALKIQKGETIDFVVDIGDVLNSDQYLWEATLSASSESEPDVTWNSKSDFPQAAHRLGAWEQLAQVLLCSNEFLFVD